MPASVANAELDHFHRVVRRWFLNRFPHPTPVQADTWRSVRSGDDVLVVAPTGSGKTLAAFLFFLDRLLRTPADRLPNRPYVVYVSPLRALSNDIALNLRDPLAEIRSLAESEGSQLPELRVLVRTGDTPPYQRQRMLRHPPHILVTTPESLFLMLTAARSRELLRWARAVIVDEIHALVQNRRGAHLAISLERLDHLAGRRLQRIGLSATLRPLSEVAAFLVGAGRRRTDSTAPPCTIIDHGHRRNAEITIVVPNLPLSAVCSREVWESMLDRLAQDILAHRSTLVFVPTRRLAERLARQLRERLGEEKVAGHHGSLAASIRHDVEQRLKRGELRAIVATSSLELGIDIGFIDLVCNIGSPRTICSFLQRLGRSGHAVGRTSKGHLYPLTWDELLEAMTLVSAVQRGELEQITIPSAPLDILAQQIVAICAAEGPCQEEDLFQLVRRAWPYRDLKRDQFERVLDMLAARTGTMRRPLLQRDPVRGIVRARRGARSLVQTNAGAIPETAEYPVYNAEGHQFIGTVNEDFALESCIGDVFLLGNRTWEVQYVRRGEMIVRDAGSRPATVPFWLGEAPARSRELSQLLCRVREDLQSIVSAWDDETYQELESLEQQTTTGDRLCGTLPRRLRKVLADIACRYRCDLWAAFQALRYVAVGYRGLGTVPTLHRIVFERFFDDTGGMQIVVHSPWGARINRAWALALRKRFCRRFDFELQAAADDNGFLLSVGPQHSFPLELLFELVNADTLRPALEQAVLASPLFLVRWRWNANRSLLVLRNERGKRVPPPLQRFRADDLLAAIFPQQVACFEQRPPDLPIPDHPLVQQTMRDCLEEALDIHGAVRVLHMYRSGEIEFLARDTREPSPFTYALLNARPYTFLDDAPLEERRSRAVITGRLPGLSAGDLMHLEPDAIDAIRGQNRAAIRSADDLLDALSLWTILPAERMEPEWLPFAEELTRDQLAAELTTGNRRFLVATDQLSVVLGAYGAQDCSVRPSSLATSVAPERDRERCIRALVAGLLEQEAIATCEGLSQLSGLEATAVRRALEQLEHEGLVVRGRFDPRIDPAPVQWANRRLLWRITRLTIRELRARIAPVSVNRLAAFLLHEHGVSNPVKRTGPEGLYEVIGLLEGWHAPAGCWEPHLLRFRCADYASQWLDRLHLEAAVVWARLDGSQPGNSTLHRATPLTLCWRDDLDWILPEERRPDTSGLSSAAREVYECLAARGALFERDLPRLTGLLESQAREALLELAAAGLATSDSFAAIRPRIAPQYEHAHRKKRRLRGAAPRTRPGSASPGRWSLVPWENVADAEKRAENWAKLLLRRYGVACRDFARLEPNAPRWRYILRALRTLELKGEVRGGVFVEGLSGEQFMLPESVDRLRESFPETDFHVLSCCDPLCNEVLLGKVLPPARHTNFVAVRGGAPIAVLEGDELLPLTRLSRREQQQLEQQFRQAIIHRTSFHLRWRTVHLVSP